MIYPHALREAARLPDPVQPMPTYYRYEALYTVIDITGETVNGKGIVEETGDEQAHAYAIELLRGVCPECDGYRGHEAVVTKL